MEAICRNVISLEFQSQVRDYSSDKWYSSIASNCHHGQCFELIPQTQLLILDGFEYSITPRWLLLNVLWVFTSFVQPPCESCVTFDQLCGVYWSWNTSRYVAIRQKKHSWFPTEIWQGLHAVAIHHPDFFFVFVWLQLSYNVQAGFLNKNDPNLGYFEVWDTPVYARIAHT